MKLFTAHGASDLSSVSFRSPMFALMVTACVPVEEMPAPSGTLMPSLEAGSLDGRYSQVTGSASAVGRLGRALSSVGIWTGFGVVLPSPGEATASPLLQSRVARK